MKLAWTSLAVVLVATSAQAANDPVMAYYPNDGTEISAILANICTQRGILITEPSATHVVCSKEMSGLSGAFAQAMVGNSYSTTPNQIVRFSITKVAGYWSVQAAQWIETQMAFGQVRRVQLDSKKQKQSLLSALLGVGFSMTPPPPQSEPLADVEKPVTKSVGSIADEIEKLASLRQKGLITEQEFQDQKYKLLRQ